MLPALLLASAWNDLSSPGHQDGICHLVPGGAHGL